MCVCVCVFICTLTLSVFKKPRRERHGEKRERKKWGETCDVYDGYLIWKDEDGWNAVEHMFNVVDGKVHELTNLSDTWDKNTYYIGKKK